jgi:uncharacterized membrane protein YebE (DUF533 family)
MSTANNLSLVSLLTAKTPAAAGEELQKVAENMALPIPPELAGGINELATKDQENVMTDSIRNFVARLNATKPGVLPQEGLDSLYQLGKTEGLDLKPNLLEIIANSNAVRNPLVMGGIAAGVPLLAYGAYRYGKSKNKVRPEDAQGEFPKTASEAFVAYRKNYKQAEIDWKSMLGNAANYAGQATDYISKNPWAQGALGGLALGGLSGVFSPQPGSILRNALYGAGLGAAGGGAYQMLRNPYAQQAAEDAKWQRDSNKLMEQEAAQMEAAYNQRQAAQKMRERALLEATFKANEPRNYSPMVPAESFNPALNYSPNRNFIFTRPAGI